MLISARTPTGQHAKPWTYPFWTSRWRRVSWSTGPGDPDQQAGPADLATAVGGLPLALEQAAAYIQASGTSVPGYLQLFRQRRDAMLARGEPTGYSKTVATTWSLAFTQLEESAPAAVDLLRLLAYFAPEAIPLSLLLHTRSDLFEELGAEGAAVLMPLLDDQLAASDAIAALRRYSLVFPAGKHSGPLVPVVFG